MARQRSSMNVGRVAGEVEVDGLIPIAAAKVREGGSEESAMC